MVVGIAQQESCTQARPETLQRFVQYLAQLGFRIISLGIFTAIFDFPGYNVAVHMDQLVE
jgi:hypothetical protein